MTLATAPRAPAPPSPLGPAPLAAPLVDERAARAELRRQIARLEAALGGAVLEASNLAVAAELAHAAAPASHSPLAGGRLLSLGDLECLRDGLVERLDAVRETAIGEAARHAQARDLLEAMLAEPGHHRWVRVRNSDLGLPGCKSFHVRPRLGPLGMLLGWWRVVVSSGCPLPGRLAGAPHPCSSGAMVRPASLSCSQ